VSQIRDSGRQQYSAVEAEVQDYVDVVVGGAALEVVFPSARTLYAWAGYESAVQVVCEGSGGGFCWKRQWPRSDLTRVLRSGVEHDPEMRRGPKEEIVPEGYR